MDLDEGPGGVDSAESDNDPEGGPGIWEDEEAVVEEEELLYFRAKGVIDDL